MVCDMEQKILKLIAGLTNILLVAMLTTTSTLLVNGKISPELFCSTVGFWVFVYLFVNTYIIVIPSLKKHHT